MWTRYGKQRNQYINQARPSPHLLHVLKICVRKQAGPDVEGKLRAAPFHLIAILREAYAADGIGAGPLQGWPKKKRRLTQVQRGDGGRQDPLPVMAGKLLLEKAEDNVVVV